MTRVLRTCDKNGMVEWWSADLIGGDIGVLSLGWQAGVLGSGGVGAAEQPNEEIELDGLQDLPTDCMDRRHKCTKLNVVIYARPHAACARLS